MKKIQNNKGMTLIEVILALAILAIVLVAILNLFSSGLSTIYSAGHRTETTEKVQEIVDELYAQNNTLKFTTVAEIKTYLTGKGYNIVTDINQITTKTAGKNINCFVANESIKSNVSGFEVTLLQFFENDKQKVKTTIFLIKGGW